MRKLIQILNLFFLAVPSVFGYAHWEGYCEQGGQRVVTNSAYSTTKVQQSYPLATLTVYLTGVSPLTAATIYSDNNGTPLANPLTCSKTGYFQFWAAQGYMDLQFSGVGVPAPFTWGSVAGVDPDNTNLKDLTVTGTTTLKGPIIGSNIVTVSPENPLYVYAHFRDDDQLNLRLAYSRDALNYSEIGMLGVYAPPSGNMRDPSIMFVPDNPADPQSAGTFYVAATPGSGPPCNVQFMWSRDMLHWTYKAIDLGTLLTGCVSSWAPEWENPAQFPASNSPSPGQFYFWISVGYVPFSYNTAKTPTRVLFDTNSNSIVSTANITLNGTTQSNTFDYYPYYLKNDPNPYKLFYVDQQPVACGQGMDPACVQPIAYAQATNPGGPYTQISPAGSDYFGWGTLATEGPAVFPLPNGCVRIMVDEWTFPLGQVPPIHIGREYTDWYRDSCPSAGALFTPASLTSPPVRIHIGKSEHGTVMPIYNSYQASVPFNAAATNAATNIVVGNHCLNVQTCDYLLTARALPSSGSGITTQQVPTLALEYGPGQDSTLSGCYPVAQGCWPGKPSTGRLFQYYNGDGSFGQFQLVQSKDDGASETSILFCGGCGQAGSPPIPGAMQGWNAVWSFGENNTSLGGVLGGVGNHRLFAYNGGLLNGIYVTIGTVNTDVTGKNITLVSGTLAGLVAGQLILVNNTPCAIAFSPPVTSTTLSCTTSVGINLTGTGINAIRQGGVPFQISPVTGLMRAGYGIGFGAGAPEAYGTNSNASLYNLVNNGGILNVDDGVIPQTAVNVQGTFVSWVTGPTFTAAGGDSVFISGALWAVASSPAPTSTSLTLTSSAGTQYGVQYMPYPRGQIRARGFTAQKWISQSGGSNTDISGFLAIPGGGTATRTFDRGVGSEYSSQPLCTGSNSSSLNPIRVFTSISGSNYVLNIQGTPGDQANYVCIAHTY